MASEPKLTEAQHMALKLLSFGPDQPGVVDSDERLAAMLIFMSLWDCKLASFEHHPDGPIFSITPAGRIALDGAREGETR